LRDYTTFESRSGRSIGFHRTGALTLAGPDQGELISHFRSRCEELSDMGIRVELVDDVRMKKIFPGLNFRRGSLGVWEPDAGFIDPQRTVRSFAALARTYGAVTRLGVEVTDIQVHGGRVSGVSTSEGEYEVEKVVIVAGPESRALAERLGFELPLRALHPEEHTLSMPRLEVAPVAEESQPGLGFHIEGDLERFGDQTANVDEIESADQHPILIDLENGFSCCCDPQSKSIRVGRTQYELASSVELVEVHEQASPEGTSEWALGAIAKRLPDHADRQCVGPVEGWYTMTPDAQPIIGALPDIEGLFVATGFSGRGFRLAPAVGEGMAQMLAESKVSAFDPEAFSLERFSATQGWQGIFSP
jgi:glycine/D-amino acid oxidase-like deaminating enzyme